MGPLEKGDFCPLIKDRCMGLKCAWFTHIKGKNPQSEEMLDHYGCAVEWLPILLIENAQQNRQTGAAVESFRNAVIEGQQRLALSTQEQALLREY